jgi:superfamily II DNA or RNA helicase
MQILQPATARAGCLVRVRGARWRVADVRAYDDCQLVTLTGVGPAVFGEVRRVLAPFDAVEPIDRPPRPRFVRAAPWRRACRALIAGETPPAALRSVRHARIDVMPHQLEPALAVLRGLGSRLLLADEVGLGKTIQAGIIVAELQARGWAERVLVLTPAGLRDQWAQELSTRFGLAAQIADAARMRRRAAAMPLGVNPWSMERLAVVSIDYVKRPEVVAAVAATAWDVLVIDEAHAAAGDSDRRAAVSALAECAACVLLLTATPHSGDRHAFASLCGLGSVDRDPLIVFRRSRSDVRSDAIRRVHALHVRPTPAEAHMHALLARYTDAIRIERGHACLAASVLHKRALSSAWALAQSVDRRLDAVARIGIDRERDQLVLPLGDPDGELTTADEAPSWPVDLGLADAARETRMLGALLSAARAAAAHESKVHAIRRLLRRAREAAIIFTEYRDTLLHVQRCLDRSAAVLHGGLTRDERAAAIDDFCARGRSVLLATDAAGEGLNLHHTCRLVINLELPWNPMRLEQRVGRVDRIGQSRAVHAFHLIAAGTGETRLLARLKRRVARAQADIGAPDPLGADEERRVARLIILGSADEPDPSDVRIASESDATESSCPRITPDLRSDAAIEAARIVVASSLTHPGDDEARTLVESDGPWILRARRSALRRSLGHRVICLWTVAYEDAGGRVIESTCVPSIIELSDAPHVRDRVWIADLVRQLEGEIQSRIHTFTADWREAVDRMARAVASVRLTRERAIAARLADATPATFQPGLFDRRAERGRAIAAAARRLAYADRLGRIDRLQSSAAISPMPPRLLLVVAP